MPIITHNNDFIGASKKLDVIDLPNIAALTGLEQDVLRAFVEVECQGNGFDSQGRPTILYEPHVFWRNCHDAMKRKEAAKQRVAAQRWGAIPYGKYSEQYDRLKKAMRIDREAALKACSWGLPQILGENFKLAGYQSVDELVLDFMEDEENQLESMTVFIKKNPRLLHALRSKDWASAARIYNGSGYKKNKYDTRLAAAYARWCRVADIPPTVQIARNTNEEMPAQLYAAGLSGTEALAWGIKIAA